MVNSEFLVFTLLVEIKWYFVYNWKFPTPYYYKESDIQNFIT